MGTKAIETQEIEKKVAALTLPAEASRRGQARWQWFSRGFCKTMLFLAGDAIAVVLSHWIAEATVKQVLRVPLDALNPPGYRLFYLPFLVAVLCLFEGYQSPDLRRPERELALIFKAVSFSFVALVCADFVFFKALSFSRYFMITWYLLALVFLLLARFSLRASYGLLWRRGLAQQKALLIGSPTLLAEYQSALAIQRYQGYRMVGVIPADEQNGAPCSQSNGLPILGSLENWEGIALQQSVQLIVVCLPTTSTGSQQAVLEILQRCRGKKKIAVEVHSDLFGSSAFNYELDEFSGFFRFYATPRWSRQVELLVKRILDRVVGLTGTLVALLLTPVVGLLLKLEDGGLVFYRREFVGCDGNIHYYYKFRTMREDADHILQNTPVLKEKFAEKFKLPDDPRVLRVGRFLRKYSIDEFPQFFSLLIGQLTFVGPRVISWDERDRYGAQLKKLLSVKPGLTGFWQVMGRQTTTYDERIRMDMFYLDHWSIWLDFIIIAKTFWKVLRAEGAH